MSISNHPNVIMLVADDHQSQAMNWAGCTAVQTPALDRLAHHGTAFTRAYHMGGCDDAVCIPTRASLLTGMNCFNSMKGGRGVISPSRTTLPECFKRAGYCSHAVGKWHNDRASLARSFDDGSALFIGGMHDHYRTPLRPFDKTGAFPDESEYIGEGFSMDIFADAACSFLSHHHQHKPFFLYTAFTAPHDPRTPPPEYHKMYPPEHIELPPNFMPEHPFDHGTQNIRDELLAPYPRTPDRIQEEIAAYYGMITSMDAGIHRILDTLDKTDHAENTIVVYTGDHGLAVGQHGLLGKQNVYEHSVRVPMIISGPRIPKNLTIDKQIYTWDIFPTLCELSEITAPDDLDARSLTDLMEDTHSPHRETVCAMYMNTQHMITDTRWKLIACSVNGVSHLQLFDLLNDPWEMNNLAESPKHTTERNRLLQQLETSPPGLPTNFNSDY